MMHVVSALCFFAAGFGACVVFTAGYNGRWTDALINLGLVGLLIAAGIVSVREARS